MKSETTAGIDLILRRHPDGVTPLALIQGLICPTCTYSQAQQAYRTALSDGRIRVGWAGRLFAKEVQDGK